MGEFKVPVSWTVTDFVEVEADSFQDAVQFALDNADSFPLGPKPEYLEGSWAIEGQQEFENPVGEVDLVGLTDYLESCGYGERRESVDAMVAKAAAKSEEACSDMLTVDVLQIKRGVTSRRLLYVGLNQLRNGVDSVLFENYEPSYHATYDVGPDLRDGADVMEYLERMLIEFVSGGPCGPSNFSMKKSDVVVLSKGGACKAYFCDATVFAELPDTFVKDFVASRDERTR